MNKLTIFCLLLCATMTFSFIACGDDEQEVVPAEQPKDEKPAPVEEPEQPQGPFELIVPETNWPLTDSQLSQASCVNDFAFRLFRQLQEPGKSLVLSPLSVDYALGMLALGSDGETRDSLASALGFDPKNPSEMHNLFASLMAYLPSVDENVQLNLANALYLNAADPELGVNPDYQKVLKESYQADCDTVDVTSQEGINYMNAWCSKQTNDFIPQVFNGPLPETTVATLINALYFKGKWVHPFKSDYNPMEAFTREDGTKTRVPMMYFPYVEERLSYLETDSFQAIRLLYGEPMTADHPVDEDKQYFGMTVLLPRSGKTTSDILSWLSAEHVAELSIRMKRERVCVHFPRFETKVKTDLKQSLHQLGLKFNECDIRGIALKKGEPLGLILSDAFQMARISVNTEGTEAGAVTVLDVTGSGICPNYFIANRPFVYLLTEQQTGTILFVGTYHGD